MKPIIILAMLLLALLPWTACKKTDKSNAPATAQLQGLWELEQSFSGMSPLTNYPPGNGHLLYFGPGNYARYRNNQVIAEGPYRLSTDSFMHVNNCTLVPPASSENNTIVFDNQASLKVYFEIKGDRLTTTTGCIPADGGYSIYRKKGADKPE